MSIPVYRNGVWIHYDVPDSGVSLWSQCHKLKAAAIYATALTKGYSKETSSILAECFISKELLGVQYNSSIEEILESFRI